MIDINDQKYQDVKEEKAFKLIKWIITEEAENNVTKKLEDSAMIQKIGKRIQGEAKCL